MEFQSNFKRREMKYLITEDQYKKIRELISEYMQVDQYGLYTICSVYFDTADNRIIRNSLKKPKYKEKLRLRSYGIPKNGESKVFLELKKKFSGTVYKRRISLTFSEAEDYIYNNKAPADSQIFREIDYFRSFYDAYPRVFIGYDRIALFGITDPSLRITFDFNIRCRRENLSLISGDYGIPLTPDGYTLMEIKIVGAQPIWLSEILSELKIYPTSFSKYGKFYTDELKGVIQACSQVS